MEVNKTYQGNALQVLKDFPDDTFHCCVTSPPYLGLRSYNTEPQIWDEELVCIHEWSKDIIANNSGGGWFDPEKRKNYEHQRLKNPKKEKQNKVSQGCFCKKCGAWKGELGLEPTPELYLKHLLQIFTEVKRVLRKDGTLFVNLGDSYAGSGSPGGDYKNKRKGDEYLRKYNRNEMTSKTLMQIPNRFAIAMTDQLGFILRNVVIWHKPSIMPSSAKDRFTQDYEQIFFFTKQTKYYFEQQFEPAEFDGRKDTKFKGSKKYNNPNISPDGAVNTFSQQGHERWKIIDGVHVRNMRAVWRIPSEAIKEEHFATFSQKLVERMIRAGCPEDGIVLDPFIGSGTTGIVARKLNRNYVGIDLAYHQISEDRAHKELGFFR